MRVCWLRAYSYVYGCRKDGRRIIALFAMVHISMCFQMWNTEFFHNLKYPRENELFKLKAWKQLLFSILIDCFFILSLSLFDAWWIGNIQMKEKYTEPKWSEGAQEKEEEGTIAQ